MDAHGTQSVTADDAPSRLRRESTRMASLRVPELAPAPSALLVLGLVVLAYLPSFRTLGAEWAQLNSYAHGWIVAPMAFYLAWSRRAIIATLVPAPSLCASVLVALLSVAWLVAFLADIDTLQQVLLPFLFIGAVAGALGFPAARKLAAPAAFFLFAIPFWDYLRWPLQLATVRVAETVVGWFGVPAVIRDTYVAIPAGTFEIAGGCSGVNFLLVALALTFFKAEREHWAPSYRWPLIGAAFVLALVANWVRVATIILVGEASSMQHALVHDHKLFGWFVFGVAIVPFLLATNRVPVGPQPHAEPSDAGRIERTPARTRKALLALGALLVGPLWSVAILATDAGTAALPTLAADGNWQRLEQPPPAPFSDGDGREVVYRSTKRPEVLLLVAPVRGPATSFASDSLRAVAREIETPAGRRIAQTEILDEKGQRSIFWQWYRVGRDDLSDSLRARLSYAVRALEGSADARVMVLASPCAITCDAARAALAERMTEL